MKAPTKGAVRALKRVVAYMGQTSHFRIGGMRVKGDKVEMWCDSDCGGDTRTGLTTRSTSGRIVLLNGIPVDWASKV